MNVNRLDLDLNKWLRRIAACAAAIYTISFFWHMGQSFLARRIHNLDIDWAVPDNPQSMIALCLVTAAVALYFLHQTGRYIAALLFLGDIAFFVRWAILTAHVRSNMGVSSIPGGTRFNSFLIGGNWLDVITFFFVIGLFLSTIFLAWLNRHRQLTRKRKDALRPSNA